VPTRLVPLPSTLLFRLLSLLDGLLRPSEIGKGCIPKVSASSAISVWSAECCIRCMKMQLPSALVSETVRGFARSAPEPWVTRRALQSRAPSLMWACEKGPAGQGRLQAVPQLDGARGATRSQWLQPGAFRPSSSPRPRLVRASWIRFTARQSPLTRFQHHLPSVLILWSHLTRMLQMLERALLQRAPRPDHHPA
jgi:hypothetical protein